MKRKYEAISTEINEPCDSTRERKRSKLVHCKESLLQNDTTTILKSYRNSVVSNQQTLLSCKAFINNSELKSEHAYNRISMCILLPVQKNQKMALHVQLNGNYERTIQHQNVILASYTKSEETMSSFQLPFQKEVCDCLDVLRKNKFHCIRQYVKKVFLQSFNVAQENSKLIFDEKWPSFIVETKDPAHSELMIAFTSHLTSTDHIALIPIIGTKFQFIIYQESNILKCVLVPRFNLILDIDDTLITSRLPKHPEDSPRENEQNLYIPVRVKTKEDQILEGKIRFFISKRNGVEEMLLWASQIFNICFITNGAYIYARAVLHYLDPERKHILKYVGCSEESLREILKSREDLLPHSISKRIGLKKLQLFDLPLLRSVILDDDKSVWDESNQGNILPYEHIISAQSNIEYLNRVSEHIWRHLEYLSSNLKAITNS